MGKRVVDEASLAGVADAIRARTGKADELVFPEGFSAGVEDVFAAGVQSEYDRFWDAFQQSGNRTDYSYGFYGAFWDEDAFKPKYDIVPTNPVAIFQNNEISDLSGHLEQLGVVLDTSKCTNINNMFYYSSVRNVPPISAVGCTSAIVGTFAHSKVTTIENLILKDDGSNTFTNPFGTNGYLTNITVTGTIGQNGFNVQTCPLSHDSIASVINALSATTSGLSVTFSKTAVNTAFETLDGAADGADAEEWAQLAATRSNWTINLV